MLTIRPTPTPAPAAMRAGSRWLFQLALLLLLMLPGLQALRDANAAAPPANAVIGNQATATYTDGSGEAKSATSNLVETVVRQVGSLALVQDNSKTAAIGNTVYMPHTLTNAGNGADSFVLSTADVSGADSDFATGISLYADANGDGVPDTTTPLATGIGATYTTPSLVAGGTFRFVVSMSVPVTAGAGDTDQIRVTAAGSTLAIYDGDNDGVFGEPGDNEASNVDSLTVTGSAAFQVTKSISLSQGPAGTVATYTLTYSNIGAAAGSLAIEDVIGSGATAGFSYIANSGIWSAGATALSDGYTIGVPDATVGGSEMHFEAATTGSVTTLRATVTNVSPNVTGTLAFRVNVLATALVGTTTTSNAASFAVDADSDPTNNNALGQLTNVSSFDVLASRSLVTNDGTGAPTDGANARPAVGDTDSPANPDLGYIASASPRQTVSFGTTVWNTGNLADTFNVSAAGLAGGGGYGAWPAGTTFQLYKSDGATPLTDSGADGVADTGPVAAGGSYVVVVRAMLPANACDGGCPAGPFDVQVTATSVGDPSRSNPTFVRIGALQAPAVDLANSSGSVDVLVDQDAIGAAPTTTISVLPGAPAVFDLYVRNESGAADSYTLAYSGTNTFAPATQLPAGWSVQFRSTAGGVCSAAGGTVITSVGPLAAGAEQRLCAVVTTLAGAPAGSTEVYFQVRSLATGATDSKWDRITITEVNSLTLAPSHTGQVFPGGTVVYPYTLANTGNTSCGTTFSFTVNESLAAQGWSVVLYRDLNGDGAIDAGDTVIVPAVGITGVTLAPGESLKVLAKVFAPAGAPAGATDVVAVSVTATCATQATLSNTATGTTTVISGQVRLTKLQAIDHDCDGTPSLPTPDPAGRVAGAALSTVQMQAFPGECIVYRVTAANEGLGNVSALSVSDTLPVHTLFGAGPTCSVGVGAFAGSLFQCSGITLAPSESAAMEFRVRVQP